MESACLLAARLADPQSSRCEPAFWLLKLQCQVWFLSVHPINDWQ